MEQKNREEKNRREKIREEKQSEEKMQVREKVGKYPNTGVFRIISGSRGSKSRLPKAAGAEPSGQMRDEKLHAVQKGVNIDFVRGVNLVLRVNLVFQFTPKRSKFTPATKD